MKNRLLETALVLLFTTAFSWTIHALDWPQWQGPDRTGISKETGLLQEWPSKGPPLAWKSEKLGGGDSAPAIVDGRILGMSHRGGDEVVWAHSEKDGSELWVARIGPAHQQGMRQSQEGPGSTMTGSRQAQASQRFSGRSGRQNLLPH